MGLLGGLISGGLGLLGQRSANKANSAQAARSMAFQKEMAKNAQQYEVADLKKAGLNPLLSGTGGKGASASGGAQAKIENEVSSALSAKLIQAQISKMNEETNVLKTGIAGKTLGTNATSTLGNLAPALGGAASAFGAQKLFNRHIKSKPKLKSKSTTTKTKGGWYNKRLNNTNKYSRKMRNF